KSAVINYLHRARRLGEDVNPADLAASFQQAVVDVLVHKTVEAAVRYRAGTILLAGGVAANSHLRSCMTEASAGYGFRLVYPPLLLCTDNAAMIACAAFYRYLRGDFSDLALNAVPGLELGGDN
ncbi:MAG: tRNA (adenosine(37)-N6)-threonylcarbamoyltransferase complex transferase subunit TsaD, partial [Firmicutes bacterium]|nr:tRNA (adenosine(37)-N6)-threonylcarbamoyltransferase complex transferase subunit TsaD [Bacillota bacterium]